jgi:phosphate transport system protein
LGRDLYHQKMARLERETLDLGHIVAGELPAAIDAILRCDTQALEDIIAGDERVNNERLAIEGQVMLLIATQQPVAVDMRLLASLLEVVGEIERMGDYVKGIARIGLRLGGAAVPPELARALVTMGDHCQDMLRRALNAFAARDAEAARAIIGDDDAVDALYNQVFRGVLDLGAPDAAQMERSNYVLWIAHNLERTADRVTNICERTIYVVTGALVADAKSAMELRLSALAERFAENEEEDAQDGPGPAPVAD